jgi:predicted enzyme related to lactoylglutathione lyase
VSSTEGLYGEAYGWRFEAKGPEWGNSFVAILPDDSLCGIRAPLSASEKPIVRTYLRVTDIEAAVQEAERLGAEIALQPMEIPGQGKIAIYLHGGIEQGLWQVP